MVVSLSISKIDQIFYTFKKLWILKVFYVHEYFEKEFTLRIDYV